jgi:NAD(P)-dependent dehydrogenase (short-subunit alcohol dehydrogenase family)
MSHTVLISGASKGIGRALAERLTTQGHTVIGFARAGDATFPGDLRTVDPSKGHGDTASRRCSWLRSSGRARAASTMRSAGE